jgi:hypothetical protein
MATEGEPDFTEQRLPPRHEQSSGLTEWMRATAGRRPGTFPENPFDKGVFNQAREWLAEVRAEPGNGLLSDRGVAELVIAHALMRIRSLEEQCSWLRDRMADDERALQAWRGA